MKLYELAAFRVPQHRSVLYRSHLDRDKLVIALADALDREANVISIREVVEA